MDVLFQDVKTVHYDVAPLLEKPLLKEAGFEILECGVSSDIRPGRDAEKWVNVIARQI